MSQRTSFDMNCCAAGENFDVSDQKCRISKEFLHGFYVLDCQNEQIVILEHNIIDEDVEAKKKLKSLGYIK